MVIEVDGGQHAINTTKDMLRDEWLRGEGYDALLTPHPDPLPQGERGDEYAAPSVLNDGPLTKGRGEMNFDKTHRGIKEEDTWTRRKESSLPLM